MAASTDRPWRRSPRLQQPIARPRPKGGVSRPRAAGGAPKKADPRKKDRKPRADSQRNGKLRVGFSLPMDVLLVDDHPIIHETLAAVLRSVAPEAQMHSETDLGNAI